jgi:hypothetical protein
LGDKTSLFPGHVAVFRGEYSEWGDPIFETVVPEPLPLSEFSILMMKLEVNAFEAER